MPGITVYIKRKTDIKRLGGASEELCIQNEREVDLF